MDQMTETKTKIKKTQKKKKLNNTRQEFCSFNEKLKILKKKEEGKCSG